MFATMTGALTRTQITQLKCIFGTHFSKNKEPILFPVSDMDCKNFTRDFAQHSQKIEAPKLCHFAEAILLLQHQTHFQLSYWQKTK